MIAAAFASRWRLPRCLSGCGAVLERFAACARGSIAAEFAAAVPVLMLLVLSGVELTRYVLLNQKLERASATVADLVSQAELLSEADLVALYQAALLVAAPFDLEAEGRVVLSSITATQASGPRIAWQRAYGAGAGASAFGIQGGAATLPAGFVVRDGENAIAAEVFFGYEPSFFATEMAARNLYTVALFRPRFARLATVAP